MTSPSQYSPEELRILLLRYLEGSLSGEEAREVSELLRTSAIVSQELEGLRKIMQTLKTDKTLFCPDPSDICEFVATGHDATGKIVSHLRECVSCRQEAQALKDFRPASKIPPQIWSKVSEKMAQRTKRDPGLEAESSASHLFSLFSSLFKKPVLAVGAVALAALLVVFLYPRQPIGPMIALSSVSWEHDLTMKTPILPRDREPVAFIIVLKDFKPQMSPQRIHSLYEALKPDEQNQKRYDIAVPSRIKEALGGADSSSTPVEESFKLLHKKLGVRRVVLVTLVSEKNQIRIRGESMDAASGKPMGKPVEAVATAQALESTLRGLVYSSLNGK
ncbi:MAG: hypothetical protein ACLP5H_29860 [Desulfomonilaceae bacterium]